MQQSYGPGWVAGVFCSDVSGFLAIKDLARYLGVHHKVIHSSIRRLGIKMRPCRIEANLTVYEPFTDEESRRIIAHVRAREGARFS